jgi:sulfhydrogenase subunit beta (sulfur reductase)
MPTSSQAGAQFFIEKKELERLILALRAAGYQVIGPRVEQEVVVYAELETAQQLPRGWSDAQEPAKYRLRQEGHGKYFAYNLGPHSWKQFLFPPKVTVATADRTADGWRLETPSPPTPRFAFLGVRACELRALAIQDRVFLEGPSIDPIYRQRRESALIIAVNCTQAASTCFCNSMDSGPRCSTGFDLGLTEIASGFIVEVGTEAGAASLSSLNHRPAFATELASAESERRQAVDQLRKPFDSEGLRDLLLSNLEHPRWDAVAERCLSCTNCTMVCPTCFCSTVSEITDLEGMHVERERQWDSCFNLDFSYLASGIVRNDRRSRYRQWLTHKLASWHDQFDTSGCVGCGRCITWCPVGIDLTEEVAAIRTQPNENRTLPVIQPKRATVCHLGGQPA